MKKLTYLTSLFSAAVIGLTLLCGCDGEKTKTPTKCNIKIDTIPTGAKILYKGKEISTTPYSQESVAPGFKLIKLEKAGYETKWLHFTGKAGENHIFEERLTPIKSSIMLTSSPSRASVTVNGNRLGETPLVVHNMKAGEYKAEVKAQGYSSKTVVWEVTDSRPQKVNVNLDSNTGIIQVKSNPEGSTIYIDGQPYGLTPGKEEIEEGQHVVRIEKVGYESYEQSIAVGRGTVKKVFANLKIKPSSISVSTNPSGAEVFINGESYSNSPTKASNLPPGDYIIMARQRGFDDEIREITLAPGQQAQIAMNLGTNLGGIDLVVNPPGVTIYLDGKKVGVSQADSDGHAQVFPLRKLTSGRHEIRFSHKRATPQNKTIRVSVQKGKIARPNKVTMWIANTLLTLRDRRVLKGRLVLKNDKEVIFQETPKITQGYKIEEVLKIEPLTYEE